MLYTSYCINGLWEMNYTAKSFAEENNPWTDGFPVEKAVPGYWEDLCGIFRDAPFYTQLVINPEYGNQYYPMTQTPPDTALPTISGTFFYHRTFTIDPCEGEWELHFGGVQNSVRVWVNNVYLGVHQGYSTPFSLSVPKDTLKKENDIVLVVSNVGLTGFDEQDVSGLTNRAACQYTGGITGDVELRCYTTPLRDAAVEIDKDLQKVTVHMESTREISVHWQVLDEDIVLMEGDAQTDFSFPANGLACWSPESPKLYNLKIYHKSSCISKNFGLRRLMVEGTDIRLNGIPYYLRGVCEHCYYPLTIHPSEDPAYYRKIILKFKELGFNFIRFHTHVPPEAYMQAADELGILIQVESPNYTSLEEYAQIVSFCRRHTSVVIYCCGNELEIDEPFIEYLNCCADMVHDHTDALFSPMSALRGVEYFWMADKREGVVLEPFERHPERQKRIGEFSDLYNSYTLGSTSYYSLTADANVIDRMADLYKKPRLSHEICIHGTYTDLSVMKRYENTPIGHTRMFSSIREGLKQKGLLEKAPLFYVNSCQWQRRLRKHCFEATRLCRTLGGFDFLGPIDTHWHTFGYDVGMMNEFYEMKPGESMRDVRMYNSPTVILSNLGTDRIFAAGKNLEIELLVSHFGAADLKDAVLSIQLFLGDNLLKELHIGAIKAKNGSVSHLYDFVYKLPQVENPSAMKLYVQLECGNILAENEWELYLFPETTCDICDLVIDPPDAESLWEALDAGKDVLMLKAGPLVSIPTSFQIALAGRTVGNLATVIADHPAISGFPHEGFCGWQFRRLLEGGSAVVFSDGIPFDPIIEVASSHKNPNRQAILFEVRVGRGRMLVCGFQFSDLDPAACWLKTKLMTYMKSDLFAPCHNLTKEQLYKMMGNDIHQEGIDTNRAFNKNDKAAIRKRHDT